MVSPTPKLCIVEDCDREAFTRGLCRACYAKARQVIRANEVTESDLIERGLMLPSRQGQRKLTCPMSRALERSRA